MIVCTSKKYILCEVYSFSSFMILLRKRLIVALRKKKIFPRQIFLLNYLAEKFDTFINESSIAEKKWRRHRAVTRPHYLPVE